MIGSTTVAKLMLIPNRSSSRMLFRVSIAHADRSSMRATQSIEENEEANAGIPNAKIRTSRTTRVT